MPRMLAGVVQLQASQQDMTCRRGTAPTQSPMTASIVCDAVRAYYEWTQLGMDNTLDTIAPTLPDLDGFFWDEWNLDWHG